MFGESWKGKDCGVRKNFHPAATLSLSFHSLSGKSRLHSSYVVVALRGLSEIRPVVLSIILTGVEELVTSILDFYHGEGCLFRSLTFCGKRCVSMSLTRNGVHSFSPILQGPFPSRCLSMLPRTCLLFDPIPGPGVPFPFSRSLLTTPKWVIFLP